MTTALEVDTIKNVYQTVIIVSYYYIPPALSQSGTVSRDQRDCSIETGPVRMHATKLLIISKYVQISHINNKQ